MDLDALVEMFSEPLTQLTVLAITLGFFAISHTGLVLSGWRRTRKQAVKWSWARFWNDVLDRGLAILILVIVIIGIDMAQWLLPLIGITLEPTIMAVLNASAIVAIPFVAGLAELYQAARNAFKLWGWAKNVKLLGLNENDLNLTDEHYGEIAESAKKFVEALGGKTTREQLIEDGVDLTNIEGEVVGKGSGNTYIEPYRSAPKDTLIDPSTCYNREAQPAGTLITMADGSYQEVELLKKGDLLFNHLGVDIVTVKSVWKTQKPVYTIKTGAGDIRFTGEHPLYVRQNKWKALALGALKAFGSPHFVKVKDLRKGDKIFMPQLTGKPLPLTDNELRWLGFYLGDGTKATKSAKCPIYRLVVPDGRKREYVDSLGIEGSYATHSTVAGVSNFLLKKKSAPNLRATLDKMQGKNFSHIVPPEQAKLILEGYLMADGHQVTDNIYTAGSTDKKLLLAIQRMVFSIGGTMSIHKKYDAGVLNRFGKEVDAKACWDSNINLKPKLRRIHQFVDGNYATVTDIMLGDQEEDVYNIEVSGSHTYIADNFGVHNCVSYTAWKIAEIKQGNWPTRTGAMSAKYWVDRLASWGYKMVSAPKEGGKYIGVVTSGTYGHVVWFEHKIDESKVQISEYNYADAGNYSLRNVPILGYIWFEIVAPSSTVTPEIPTVVDSYTVGDTVLPIKYVDYTGKKLKKTAGYYTISQISGDRAVLNDGNTIYAAVNTNNLKKVDVPTSKPENPPKDKKAEIEVGDTVTPTKLVDYNGTPLVQYDSEYIVTSLAGNRAVLSARGAIWAAMNTQNLRKVR